MSDDPRLFDLEDDGLEDESSSVEVSDDQLSMFDDTRQMTLFDVPRMQEEHWVGMPSFQHNDLMPWKSLTVHFRNRADRNDFATLLGQSITDRTRSLWHPQLEISHLVAKSYVASDPKNPRYPVYIISKGRADSRLTSKALEKMDVPYHIVVEPQEYDDYAAVIDPAKILVLPFSNLGQGSIPARNWVWDHAVASGAEKHWILDDNIRSFHRYEDNQLYRVADGTIFFAAEEFTDRYENVALSGMQYFLFIVRKDHHYPPFYLNTRIYSCILIKNDLQWNGEPMRWRGRWNEDTDLSLRVLKDGWCTVLFNAFICDKQSTMLMKGGNTEDYQKSEDAREAATRVLLEEHPDVARETYKWGRVHHHVDYRPFKKRKLILKEDAKLDMEWEFALKANPGFEDDAPGENVEPPSDEGSGASGDETRSLQGVEPPSDEVPVPDMARPRRLSLEERLSLEAEREVAQKQAEREERERDVS
jgi:hypothetical protein